MSECFIDLGHVIKIKNEIILTNILEIVILIGSYLVKTKFLLTSTKFIKPFTSTEKWPF